MYFILIFLCSFLIFKFSNYLSSKINTPVLVIYLLLGIIFGVSDFIGNFINLLFNSQLNFNLFANSTTLDPLAKFSSQISLTILFVSAGIGIDLKQISHSGKTFLKLGTLPAYAEGIIGGTLLFLMTLVVPGIFNHYLSITDAIIIMLFLSMSTAAVILPITQNNENQNLLGTKNINPLMSGISFFDIYTVYFGILIIIITTYTINSSNNIGLFNIIYQFILILGPIILAAVLSFILGIIIGIIWKFLNFNSFLKTILIITISIITLPFFLKLPNAINGLNAFTLGLGFNAIYQHIHDYPKIKYQANQLLIYFGFPIIFIVIGSTIEITKLFNPSVLFMGVSLLIIGTLIKSIVGARILNQAGYQKVDQKFAGLCFLAKGNGAVNFGLIMMNDTLTSLQMTNVLDVLQYFAVIDILISIPLSIILLNRFSPQLITIEK